LAAIWQPFGNKTMNQEIFLEFKKLQAQIEHIEQVKKLELELHPSQVQQRQAMLNDMTSMAVKKLISVGRKARKAKIMLPQELTYWMLDYVAASLYGMDEPEMMENARKHNIEEDAIREHNKYTFMVNEILMGFEKGVKEGVSGNRELQAELFQFINGGGRQKLTGRQYGYLLSAKVKKVSISDAKTYFELELFKSKSQIGKLFTKHRLNDIIKPKTKSNPA
jgi:hypothetical protein